MHQPRYAHTNWSLLVTDVRTGETLYELDPDRPAYTGSVRKLFSVGLALTQLGADHRFETPVYQHGTVDPDGVLQGNLVLVGGGDLTLGGRRNADGSIALTDFDHNDANNLGTAILTPQDPLAGLDDLARQVGASGITSVSGDVVVDDRLFDSYRVPNNYLLVTPTMVNENMVDVTVRPTEPGQPAAVDYRPKTNAFGVAATVNTGQVGIRDEDFDFPTNGSGSPDSQAAPRATVQLLRHMSATPAADAFRQALPILGVDGSLAHTGVDLPARGHVFAKTGTTVADGELKAQVLAGYVEAKSGRRLAFAVYVNHYGPIASLDDLTAVFADEARIANALYESQ
jgi:D-alanyl-D-alanine carboxypeptidase